MPTARTTRGTARSRAVAVFVFRRARALVAWTAVFTVLAVVGACQLKLDQRLRALLPSDFPSVSGIDAATQRLGNQSDIFVTLRSPSRAANIELGDALAERMAGMERLRWVQFRRDYDYFESRALLYLPLAQLLDLRRHVLDTIDAEVRAKAYGSIDLREDDAVDQPALDETELRRRYGVSASAPEFFESDEGQLLVIKARPTHPPTDLAFASALQAELERLIDESDPTRFHPEMTVQLDGAFVQHTRRVAALEGEVLAGTAAAVFGLLACITIYFRSGRAVVAVLAPVLVSAVATLAFAWAVFGALNIVSAFIFSILLGLGIDFGIHILARYRDERARGHRQPTAWAITFATTGRATAAAGLGTALAFGTLSIASFRGFAQFGVLSIFGITAALAASLVVLPALVIVTERLSPWPSRVRQKAAARSAQHAPKTIAVVVLLLGLAGAVWSATSATELAFEFDFGALGPRRTASGQRPAAGYRDAVGKAVTVAPAVAITQTPELAAALYRPLAALGAMTPQEASGLERLPPSRAPTLLELLRPDQDKRASDAPVVPAAPSATARTSEVDEWDNWDDADPGAAQLDALQAESQRRHYPPTNTRSALELHSPERRAVLSRRIVAVSALSAFIPADQDDKLTVIRDIRHRVQAKRAWMSAETLADLDEWARYLEIDEPVERNDLPRWLRLQFTDAQGEEGRFVIVWTRGSKANYLDASEIYGALGTIPTELGQAHFAAEFFVLPEIVQAIKADAPIVLGLASAAMLLTAWLALRSIGGPLAVAVVVGTSSLWLIGLMVVLDWRLNYFNIIVLPLLLGMAQDDAIHIYARWREDQSRGMGRVLRETGGAVALTTLTTICGFAGILFADHRGLESMAWLAIIGMLGALVSAVVVLPALLHVSTWFSPEKGHHGV